MTIKAKLIANLLFMAAIIVVISLASFFSMSFLQDRLSYLTEKSTPFQMRTIELQRELQGCIAILLKVNAARTMKEYTTLQLEAEKSLEAAENSHVALQKMSGGTLDVSDELDKIALELFEAVEERIISNNAATVANARVLQSMKASSVRLNDLDTSIRSLQANYSRSFETALENTGIFSGRLRNIEEFRNLVRELQLLTVTVQNIQNASAVIIAKGRLKAIEERIARSEYNKSNPSTADVTKGFVDKLAEFIKLQSVAIAQKDEDSKIRAAASGKDLPYKLNDLFQTLDQETMLARYELSLANSKQGGAFNQSNSANSILIANSELVALGLMVTAETNRLLTLDSTVELDKLDSEIRTLFTRINGRVQILESSLVKLNAKGELKIFREAIASLTAVRNEIYSVDGIVNTLKKKLNAIEQTNKAADKLHAIVIEQKTKGNESVSAARGEQEKAIQDIYNMTRRSLYQIAGVGFIAILVGSLFGYWIYRSVLLPLRVVLDAVRSQQRLGKEKASLAEAVAGGDLTQEVTISEAITLDTVLMKKDEMGMVLNAVVGMSEAQATLDRAFAGMTASLRRSRDEEASRDGLKSGLYELNKILRVEHNTAEMADEALAFIAAFLGAGVGIMYLYDEQGEMLQTLSTYAIPKSRSLNWGFPLGEGLPGQVALERKMICLDSLPPDYLQITSAMGEADPLNVTVMPILHNDTLVGVLELGSFSRFGDDDFNFLNQALEGIAIAININRSRQMVNDLLEQAQLQAEKMLLQHEELQQSNEELEERARMLAERRNYNIY